MVESVHGVGDFLEELKHETFEKYDDISTIDQYQVALEAGCSEEEALQCCYENIRDNARTPMQWSDAKHAGFTTGTPWLAVNPNYREINVAEQEEREYSVLNYYRKLIALRKAEDYRDTFTYGEFVPAYEEEESIFAYLRVNKEAGQKILVIGNYGKEACEVPSEGKIKKVLLSNFGKENQIFDETVATQKLTLESCESVVIELE